MSVTQNPAPPDALPTDAGNVAREPAKPLSPASIAAYSLANLGCGAFFSFNNYVLPLFLRQYTGNAILLGLMGSTHSVEGAIIQPLVGSASDRLETRWGRRRPFMLIFLTLSALILLLTPALAYLPGGIRLGALVASIFLFTVLFNIGFDPYQALMPDITPEAQRGRVTGVWALFGNFAQAAILLLPLLALQLLGIHLSFANQFAIIAGLMVATTLLTCALVKEPARVGAVGKRKGFAVEIAHALHGLRTLRQAAKAMLVFAIAGAGIGAVVPNLSIFVKTITHCSDQQAMLMGFVLMISTVVGVLPFGWLADRIGPKRVVFIAFGLIALAALCALKVTTLPQIVAIMIVAGLGNAAQAAAAYPLLTELVPAEEFGFYTGFQSTMLSLAQPVTVVVTGALINGGGGGYRVVFGVCALCVLAAMAVLTTVHKSAAPGEIAARNREQGREAGA